MQTENNNRFLRMIYHEQQSGALCAVHAVNSVMQKRMWNEFQFADIAKGLDDEEHSVLEVGERGKGSVNYDDSGFFSVQVVVRSLKIGGISISHLMKPEEKDVRRNPVGETAFICNHNKHWFAIRKFGTGENSRWFNLNSTFKYPEFLSNTFLSLFLEQLITEGYAVFICRGIFPACPADGYVDLFDHRTYISPRDKFTKKKVDFSRISDPREREQLRRALELSKDSKPEGQTPVIGGGYDDDLQRALEMSRREFQGGEDLVQTPGGTMIMQDEDDEIKRAIQLSLQASQEGDDQKEEEQKEQKLPPIPSTQEDEEDTDNRMKDEDESEEAVEDEENTEMVEKYDPQKRKAELSEKFAQEEGNVKIRFRVFNGKVYDTKFQSTQTIADLYDFLELKFLEEESQQQQEQPRSTQRIRNEVIIVNSYPKIEMVFSEFAEKSLEELKYSGSVMLQVVEK